MATGERAKRRAVVGPLFSYMTGHGTVALFVARRLAQAQRDLQLGLLLADERPPR